MVSSQWWLYVDPDLNWPLNRHYRVINRSHFFTSQHTRKKQNLYSLFVLLIRLVEFRFRIVFRFSSLIGDSGMSLVLYSLCKTMSLIIELSSLLTCIHNSYIVLLIIWLMSCLCLFHILYMFRLLDLYHDIDPTILMGCTSSKLSIWRGGVPRELVVLFSKCKHGA